jgi:hypothetical protein
MRTDYGSYGHVKVYGAEDFAALLRRAGRSLERKEVNKILREEAVPIRNIAKADAKMGINPKQKTSKVSNRMGGKVAIPPGTISDSIGIKIARKTTHPSVIVVPRITKNYKSGWFAHFIHAGTADRTTSKGHYRGAIRRTVKFMDRAGSPSNLAAASARVSARLINELEKVGM